MNILVRKRSLNQRLSKTNKFSTSVQKLFCDPKDETELKSRKFIKSIKHIFAKEYRTDEKNNGIFGAVNNCEFLGVFVSLEIQ